MIYSRSTEYAIQAMVYLAQKDSPNPVMVREIADSYQIPQPFLSKIVQILAKRRLVVGARGRTGGIKLNRPATEIYLPEIIQAIEGPAPEQDVCIFGLDLCSDVQPCPFHDKWLPIKEQIQDMEESENLAQLAKRVAKKHEAMKKGLTNVVGLP